MGTPGSGKEETQTPRRHSRALLNRSNLETIILSRGSTIYSSTSYISRGNCSVLTYAHETWTLNETTCRRLNGRNCRCLVKITGKEYREEATTPTFDLVTALRARRLRWLGHILRMPEERLIRQVALRQGTPATNKAIPAGGLFMDAPEHSTVPELLAIAGDREK